jgi:hypothetical protein
VGGDWGELREKNVFDRFLFTCVGCQQRSGGGCAQSDKTPSSFFHFKIKGMNLFYFSGEFF